ncbi:MAG TPA: hypothetical protein VNJ08_05145 [Bacteriovoracaceae bacterium]|nr:hypothetical protein [Bacteriovoracaceae bacterium]
MKISSALLFFISFAAFGQVQKFKINGEYVLDNSQKTGVNFELAWEEDKGKITGRYSDNHFSREGAEVVGVADDLGRQLIVNFRGDKQGARSIALITSKAGPDKTGTSVPVSIITRDGEGNPLTTTKLDAPFVAVSDVPPVPPAVKDLPDPAMIAQKEEQRPECNIGFGEIAGYCGRYGGLISEESDNKNSCDLLTEDDLSMELDTERNLTLYLSTLNELVADVPTHRIGQVPPDPENPIDVTSRTCGPLAGTRLPGDKTHCKRLNLTGTFLIERGRQHFAGTYAIYDETTKQICRYGLSLNKE